MDTMQSRVVDLSNRLLAVFSKMVEALNLTNKMMIQFPILRQTFTFEELTLLLTIIVGIVITSLVYLVFINISKFTLTFLVFAKWATLAIFVGGIVINMM